MKKNIFVHLLLVFFLYSPVLSKAQLGRTKNEVINSMGKGYEFKTPEGQSCISYKKASYSEESGSFNTVKLIMFESVYGEKVCTMWIITEPLNEINTHIRVLNKNYVKVDQMTWKDYATNRIFMVSKDGDSCVVSAFLDINGAY